MPIVNLKHINMPLKYKIQQRGETGVAGGGNKKYYASSVTDGERDIEQLTKSIEKISTVSGADIRAVLYAMVDVISHEMADGRIVRLGDLGSLRISLSSDGFATEKEVTATAIRKTKILFNPGEKLKQMQQTIKFEKV